MFDQGIAQTSALKGNDECSGKQWPSIRRPMDRAGGIVYIKML